MNEKKVDVDDKSETYQRIVVVDEPTTGLDPLIRRNVWEIIDKARIGKTIMMTTHNMAEADALANYIGILCAGQLRCCGTKNRIKTRFGTGYRLKIIHKKSDSEILQCFLTCCVPNIRFDRIEELFSGKDAVRSFYIIPQNTPISHLYLFLLKRSDIVSDFTLQFTSLEEVFLTVSTMCEPVPKDVNLEF